jgi:hypothetical protein
MPFWDLGFDKDRKPQPQKQDLPRKQVIIHVYGKGEVVAYPGVLVRRHLDSRTANLIDDDEEDDEYDY